MQGGAVLNSGTYGCIIKPAVPCKGETVRTPDSVSKLMTAKDASQEYSEIMAIKEKIKSIPESNMYYILNDIKKCQIGTVTESDLDNFKRKCKSRRILHSYTKEDIQNPRKNTNLRVLQLPDGGRDITDYFYGKPFSTDTFPKINRALIKLLKYGIVPLKEVGVIHQDIKGNNIVYSKEKDLARLIDWGLSTADVGEEVPYSVKKWPLLFNQPFSNVVLHTTVQNVYKLIVEKDVNLRSRINEYRGRNLIQYLTPYVNTIIKKHIFKNDATIEDVIGGEGHIKYIRSVLAECMITDLGMTRPPPGSSSSFNALDNRISLHITSALLHFSIKDNKMGEFDEKEYFNTVFKQNCDVFGLLSCYVDIFMNKSAPKSLRQMIYFNVLKPFYLNEKYAHTPYDIDEIAKACLALNRNYEKELVVEPSVPPPVLKRPVVDVGTDAILDKEKFPMALRKRCPNGTRMDKKTKKCLKKKVAAVVKPSISGPKVAAGKSQTIKKAISWPAGKRCPKGRHRHPKTKKCVTSSTQKPKPPGQPRKGTRKKNSWPIGRRCPNGTHRDKKTKKCVKK